MANIKLKGFSLIELMIAIGIIGLISSWAIPSYRNYIIKTKLTEVSQILHTQAQNVIDYYNAHGSWPPADVSPTLSDIDPPLSTMLSWAHTQSSDNGDRPYIETILANDSKTLGDAASGYLAVVCDEDNDIISCRCRTAPENDSSTISFLLLPANCQCNEDWTGC